ncbi:MAG: hypothetical protein JW863_01710 [Chitinispirillaceae bacterium]|nr:hypothetical protein [Chitinispirillaceae bacterium]
MRGIISGASSIPNTFDSNSSTAAIAVDYFKTLLDKALLVSILLACGIFAQNITPSKDSLKIYNNSLMSSFDWLMVRNNGDDTVWIDSAALLFDVFDTTGLSMFLEYGSIETMWNERHGDSPREIHWTMQQTGDVSFSLKNPFDTLDVQKPCTIAPGDSASIGWLQIGFCFICNSLPTYPLYMHGVLRCWFSSAEVVDIGLYSQDWREPVQVTGVAPVRHTAGGTPGGGVYLINGRRLSDTKVPEGRVRLRNRLVHRSRK